MTSAVLAGSTGLVGSHILSHLLSHPSISSVHAYTRRDLPNPPSSTQLHPLQSTDISTWPSLFPSSPTPQLFISALGTTRAAAGGLDNQRKIDLDLNLSLARAAKKAGCTTYVLISSNSASSTSMSPYLRMKGELEDKVKELGFKYTVFLQPGLIMGERSESRPAEAVARGLAGWIRKVAPGFVEGWAQDKDTIARAAVRAGLECLEGKREEGVHVIGQAEIVKLGKEEK
ncbi:NAD dependent epimerase/dehydratase family protein-like protein [Delitschia confertaspora ATCC 74209]|uniref:NAD dependent epimerase/dehydratase family protein-like protein n=1 Tax=Delitschia confertaspora ATCC 74209 TaxID=1513339 RepID=A0A9P4N319_9PLEO|nr:NAD dependent epimerase/dehydratase family protein-like protein [Delitschia confertaspora ATCC 74209]